MEVVEKKIKRLKRRCLFFSVFVIVTVTGYLLLEKVRMKRNDSIQKNITQNEVESTTKKEQEEVWEKGYNLPIDKKKKEIAETDCKMVMNNLLTIYQQADKGTADNTVLSEETVIQMTEKVEKMGYSVISTEISQNMKNAKKVEQFLVSCQSGEAGEMVIYELHSTGDLRRRQFIFDGTKMYVLVTIATWNKQNVPVIVDTSYSRIKEWNYTKKGWFIFECCVPEPPEVSEVVVGIVMIRVKPLKEEYRTMAVQYLASIGYQGNNLFCSNWDSEHMENIDYNGLYEYLYLLKYGERLNTDQAIENGISKEEFEQLILEYLPVTAEKIEQYAIYDEEKQCYEWLLLGCGNYTPNLFGTSKSEITNIVENEDGTLTLTIDVVCEMLGEDRLMTHQLTICFTEEGNIRYLSNQVLEDGLEKIPQYQYRFTRKE